MPVTVFLKGGVTADVDDADNVDWDTGERMGGRTEKGSFRCKAGGAIVAEFRESEVVGYAIGPGARTASVV